MTLQAMIETLGRQARESARMLAKIRRSRKDEALRLVAEALVTRREEIKAANRLDLEAADAAGMQGPKRDRLVLSEKVLAELRQGLLDVAALPDPVGEVVKMWTRPNGLQVGRVRIPLGVIGFIYESRPNVTIEAAALCLKAGNAILLRGGSEAFHSNLCLTSILQDALASCGLPLHAVQILPTTQREAITELLKRDDLIDVLIPRGGEALIRFVCEHARMPVLKHDKGVCHLYIDEDGDPAMIRPIVLNAKVQRPGVCNALDALLVHKTIAPTILPLLAADLAEAKVEIRACQRSLALLPASLHIRPAEASDWGCEFLSLTLACRIVDSIDEAIQHIEQYGSSHTDGILTSSYHRAHRFVQEVQSSLVLVNASTRFNDGFQLGLGAEIGISTSKLHAFGPMGLEELTTCKFVAFGQGQIRS